jgi:bifunctional non-homologous end joining protein LigD
MPIPPMLATAAAIDDVGEDHALEFKWDGIRAQVHVRPGTMHVFTRNGRDAADGFPELFPLKDALGRSAILDGEIVALDAGGRPDFGRLQGRIGLVDRASIRRAAGENPALFMAFDILSLDGRDVMAKPYVERRDLLGSLDLQGARWLTPPSYEGPAAPVLAASRDLGLEGIVAKRPDSAYTPGKRSGAWLKVRNRMRQEFVVGGWTEGQGSRGGTIGSILVGYHREPGGPLIYVGKVGSGFGGPMLPKLLRTLRSLSTPLSPFDPSSEVDGDAHYVKPTLVAEVEFSGLAAQGLLRQPSFKGLRTDKEASEVVWEQVKEKAWHAHSGADRSVLAS